MAPVDLRSIGGCNAPVDALRVRERHKWPSWSLSVFNALDVLFDAVHQAVQHVVLNYSPQLFVVGLLLLLFVLTVTEFDWA